MEDWVTIRTLKAKNPKMTNREIARLIGISHHTVKTALASGDPPAYDRADSPMSFPHPNSIHAQNNELPLKSILRSKFVL